MTGEGSYTPGDFAALFGSADRAKRMAAISTEQYGAAAEFWRVPLESPHLAPRMKELVLFAMHASAASLNETVIARQILRAKAAGASDADIVDVLISIVALANHSLYAAVPVLREELKAAGIASSLGSESPAFALAKERFIRIRQFWNPDRDAVAEMMPEYFAALTDLSVASWQHGPLTRRERELICIGIDCTVTHNYPPGLRIHIRNALAQGATEGEILEVFQLAATMGLEAYVMAAQTLFPQPAPSRE